MPQIIAEFSGRLAGDGKKDRGSRPGGSCPRAGGGNDVERQQSLNRKLAQLS